MRAWIFSIVLLLIVVGDVAVGAERATAQKNLFRIEHATSEILHQLNQDGLDVAMVRGLGSASAWRPRGVAEIDLWLTGEEVQALELRGIRPVPIRDEAHEMWERLQSLPERERDYHNYPALMSLMQAYADAFPEICQLYSIGQSVQGRELWVLKISDNPGVAEDEPEFKYIGTMHGNEPVGCEMILSLMGHLLNNYGTDPTVTNLLDNIEIHLLPMLNPDGNTAGVRQNANGYDLNRSFPDPYTSPNNTPIGRQPEVAAVMNWTQGKDFDMSANFHTGALLVNYPYDNNASGSSVYTASPDDDLFIQTSEAYSSLNLPMWNGDFFHGISNGADWYAMAGGMQDWNYRYEGGMEVTVELCDTSWPDASLLPGLWEDNRGSMLAYMAWCLRGVRGVVTSSISGLPLAGVEVRVTGRDFATWSAAGVGDYHRILAPGTYTLTYGKPGYLTATESAVVVGTGAATVRNVSLMPLVVAPDFALGAVTVVDGGNGHLDPGETAELEIQLLNTGTIPATGVVGLLEAAGDWLIVNSGPLAYGDLLPDQTAVASFSVTVSPAAPLGETVLLDLTATCAELSATLGFAQSIGLVVEDFESGNFSQWPWIQGGTAPWLVTGTTPYEGVWCGRSGDIGDNQTSRMSMTLNFVSSGVVQFAARVSSEAGYDFLRFSIDGAVQASLSGVLPWTLHSFPVPGGVHVLSWSFEKDGSESDPVDAAFVDWILLPPVAPVPQPDWMISPAALQLTLSLGGSAVEPVTMQNTGDATLNWSAALSLDSPAAPATARNAGGPDGYGYTWEDSREAGGPTYAWVEINMLGTELTDADNQSSNPLNLGFAMPWYGAFYPAVRVCTNGFLSFTAPETASVNLSMPGSTAPNNVIAPFWDDLDPVRGGTVLYWDDPAADRFVVEYNAVRHHTGTATETFQVILSGDGSVRFQYRIVNTTSSCTVGIENAAGSDGLQALYNTGGWLINNLAVLFTPPVLATPWATLDPQSGSVPAGGSSALALSFDATELADGVYTGSALFSSNDPDTPQLTLPFTLTVSGTLDPVNDLAIAVSAGQVSLSWTAVPQAAGYRVYRSAAPWSGYTLVGSPVMPIWSEPAAAGDRASYRVTAWRP